MKQTQWTLWHLHLLKLGKEDFPIVPAPTCELSRTQADSRSSIRACMCTQDFCNIVQDGELTVCISYWVVQRFNYTCRKIVIICGLVIVHLIEILSWKAQYFSFQWTRYRTTVQFWHDFDNLLTGSDCNQQINIFVFYSDFLEVLR